jgi:Sec7 domain
MLFPLRKDSSGRGTPVEKSSFESDLFSQTEECELPPPSTGETGEQFLSRLQAEQGGITKYLKKLVESSYSSSFDLSNANSDPVHIAALTDYLHMTLPLMEVPLDMAMRLLTLHIPVPREQGSIVRLLELFSLHYARSNPGLWDTLRDNPSDSLRDPEKVALRDPEKRNEGDSRQDGGSDQVLVLCYSILMLNTDAWNANNKVKMTREQYVRNTSGLGVSEDILKV